MTEFQQCNTTAEEDKITTVDAAFQQKEQCPSLLRIIELSHENKVVLGPPTSVRYDCGRDLVSYHWCQVKYYTMLGVRKASKITLSMC